MTIYYTVLFDCGEYTHWYLVDLGFGFLLEFPDDDVPGRDTYEERYSTIEEYKRMWNGDKYPEYKLVHLEQVYSDEEFDGIPAMSYPV